MHNFRQIHLIDRIKRVLTIFSEGIFNFALKPKLKKRPSFLNKRDGIAHIHCDGVLEVRHTPLGLYGERVSIHKTRREDLSVNKISKESLDDPPGFLNFGEGGERRLDGMVIFLHQNEFGL